MKEITQAGIPTFGGRSLDDLLDSRYTFFAWQLDAPSVNVVVPAATRFLLTAVELAPTTLAGTSDEIRPGIFSQNLDAGRIRAAMQTLFEDTSGGMAVVHTITVFGGIDLDEVGEVLLTSFEAIVESANNAGVQTAFIGVTVEQGDATSPPLEYATFLEHDGGANRNLTFTGHDGEYRSDGRARTVSL